MESPGELMTFLIGSDLKKLGYEEGGAPLDGGLNRRPTPLQIIQNGMLGVYPKNSGRSKKLGSEELGAPLAGGINRRDTPPREESETEC